MDKKKIGAVLIVLGIIVIFVSAIEFIMTNDGESENNIENSENNNDETNNENNENNDDNQNDDNEPEITSVCLEDYLNENLKQVATTVDGKKINIKVFACMTEQETTNNKVKFFSKEDDSFYFEISILKENLTTYLENLDAQYKSTQPTENYNIAITNDYTFNNGRKYSIINVYKKDENDNINYKDYNMIGNIDDEKIVHIRLVTTKYDLEADFIHIIEESIEIK